MADRIAELRALLGRWTQGGTIIGSPLGYTLVPAGWDGDAADLRHKQNTDEIKHLLHSLPLLLDVVEAAVRASAELRHAYRDPVIDRNLVARAIEILERSTTALAALEGVGDA